VQIEPRYPFETVAETLQERIYSGALPIGLPIRAAKALGKEYGVSPSTAQRGVQLLEQLGLVRVEPGRPTLVEPRGAPTSPPLPTRSDQPTREALGSSQQLDVEILRLGLSVTTFRTQANPSDSASLHRLLLGALKRQGARPDDIDEFELVARAVGDSTVLTPYVAMLP
jgi:DNA-binding GntR family transcriptional regulator